MQGRTGETTELDNIRHTSAEILAVVRGKIGKQALALIDQTATTKSASIRHARLISATGRPPTPSMTTSSQSSSLWWTAR